MRILHSSFDCNPVFSFRIGCSIVCFLPYYPFGVSFLYARMTAVLPTFMAPCGQNS